MGGNLYQHCGGGSSQQRQVALISLLMSLIGQVIVTASRSLCLM